MAVNTMSYTDPVLTADTTSDAVSFGGFPDRGKWVKSTFTVIFDKNFSKYTDILKYTTADEQFDNNESLTVHPEIQKILDESGDDASIPNIYKGAKFRDTSLGGNDAINPLPQFNHDDDIVHPFLSINENDPESGMGRVYSEMIDDNQQILYMAFGVPKFSGLTDFYKDAIDSELTSVMNTGSFFSMETLGRLVGTGAAELMMLPFLPLRVLAKVIDMFAGYTEIKISRYYDFKSAMPLYYKLANTILQHIAVNLGFLNPFDGTKSETPFNDTHFDLFTMMLKKYRYMKLEELVSNLDGDQRIEDYINKYLELKGGSKDYEQDESFLDKTLEGMGAGIRDAVSYIGLRIEKTVGSGESVSNSTTTSPIASNLNQRISENRSRNFSAQGGATGIDLIDGVLKGMYGMAKGLLDHIGIDGLAAVTLGSSYVDIPDVWDNSTFSTMNGSNFRMVLRAPYGDKYSYFQNICVPLASILAAALPRAAGQNSYTSPFLVNAHCPGKFSINMGIIDSINITRGAEEHGWSHTGLPTVVEVDFTIKDLAPAMFLAINDTKWLNIFAADSAFQAYLNNLGGRSLAETLLWTKNVKRRMAFAKAMAKNVHFNPISIGFNLAYTRIGRVLAGLHPGTLLPDNVSGRTDQ